MDNYTVIKLHKGDILCEKGEDISNFYLVESGRIDAYSPYGVVPMETDSIVGLVDCYYGICVYNYVASEDTVLHRYNYTSMSDLAKIFDNTPNYGRYILAGNRFIMELIRIYLSHLIKTRKKDPTFVPDNAINRWELDKYNGMNAMNTDVIHNFFNSNVSICVAALAEISRFANILHGVCLQMSDILEIDMDYVPPVVEVAPEMPDIPSDDNFNNEEIWEELRNSMGKIFNYAELMRDDSDEFIALMGRFRNSKDKLSTEENMRKLRKSITERFYRLYYTVFSKAVMDDNVPVYVQMFLNFGYLDETLAGEANSIYLYKLAHKIDDLCISDNVYTVFHWLKLILWGEKNPSHNTFDQSYEEYIRNEIRTGKLTISEDTALQDNERKVRFEIENLFHHGHVITNGKVSSFIPILLKEHIIRPLDTSLITADGIMKTINNIRAIDFSLFYRSMVYQNEKAGISKEFVQKEVLPTIILTPCSGTNAALWQDIEGRHRDTPARMIFPIFCSENLENLTLNVLGKYRWEICKRIQGPYWNVVSEKSLTSEFYDYLLFYKKNRDLSDAVKDKLKSSLINCRNNYSEVFARDYASWILYESKGSGKLNKVSRAILAKYCPFNLRIRESLKNNPMFTDVIAGYDRHIATTKRRIGNICKTLSANGMVIPDEIDTTRAYYDM